MYVVDTSHSFPAFGSYPAQLYNNAHQQKVLVENIIKLTLLSKRTEEFSFEKSPAVRSEGRLCLSDSELASVTRLLEFIPSITPQHSPVKATLTKPIVIPQQNSGLPFALVNTPILNNCITRNQFDALVAGCSTVERVENSRDTSFTEVDTQRLKLYCQAVNRDFLHPRGLHLSICMATEKLIDVIGFPERLKGAYNRATSLIEKQSLFYELYSKISGHTSVLCDFQASSSRRRLPLPYSDVLLSEIAGENTRLTQMQRTFRLDSAYICFSKLRWIVIEPYNGQAVEASFFAGEAELAATSNSTPITAPRENKVLRAPTARAPKSPTATDSALDVEPHEGRYTTGHGRSRPGKR